MELDQLDLNSRLIYTDEVLNEHLLSKNQNDFQTILANHVNKSCTSSIISTVSSSK